MLNKYRQEMSHLEGALEEGYMPAFRSKNAIIH